jgi:PPOX class probable F420-dependent enzyme
MALSSTVAGRQRQFGARRLDEVGPEFRLFWTERHLVTLATVRPDGTPHLIPVGATIDIDTATARVITSRASQKVRHVLAAGDAGAPVAICQVDGRRWSTLQGRAAVREDRDAVADAVRRYAQRYRVPRDNPQRVVIEIAVIRVLGSV